MDSKGERFRALINGPRLLLRPFAYDALLAVLIWKTGFSDRDTGLRHIGFPDRVARRGLNQVLRHAGMHPHYSERRTPVDIDTDMGYGNALNVYWTVKSLARVGATGVRIEDQT